MADPDIEMEDVDEKRKQKHELAEAVPESMRIARDTLEAISAGTKRFASYTAAIPIVRDVVAGLVGIADFTLAMFDPKATKLERAARGALAAAIVGVFTVAMIFPATYFGILLASTVMSFAGTVAGTVRALFRRWKLNGEIKKLEKQAKEAGKRGDLKLQASIQETIAEKTQERDTLTASLRSDRAEKTINVLAGVGVVVGAALLFAIPVVGFAVIAVSAAVGLVAKLGMMFRKWRARKKAEKAAKEGKEAEGEEADKVTEKLSEAPEPAPRARAASAPPTLGADTTDQPAPGTHAVKAAEENQTPRADRAKATRTAEQAAARGVTRPELQRANETITTPQKATYVQGKTNVAKAEKAPEAEPLPKQQVLEQAEVKMSPKPKQAETIKPHLQQAEEKILPKPQRAHPSMEDAMKKELEREAEKIRVDRDIAHAVDQEDMPALVALASSPDHFTTEAFAKNHLGLEKLSEHISNQDDVAALENQLNPLVKSQLQKDFGNPFDKDPSQKEDIEDTTTQTRSHPEPPHHPSE